MDLDHPSPALPRCTIVTSFPKLASLSLSLGPPDLLVAEVTDLPERDSFRLPGAELVPALATPADEDGSALLTDPEDGVPERTQWTRAGADADAGGDASWGMYSAGGRLRGNGGTGSDVMVE